MFAEKLIVLVPLVAALLFGACEGPLDPQEPGEGGALETASLAIVIGSQNWAHLHVFAEDPDSSKHQIGAHYGRAVGRIGAGGCSAQLISDVHILSADHCGGPPSTTTLRLGRFAESHAWVRRRLQSMGMAPGTVGGYDEPGIINTFMKWTCHRNRTWSWDDVVSYACETKTIPGLGEVGPGAIFGWLKLPSHNNTFDTGDKLYALGVNERPVLVGDHAHPGDTKASTLLSPGEVELEYGACSWGYTGCFNMDADVLPGSSGGAVLKRSSNQLIGIVNSEWLDWNVAQRLPDISDFNFRKVEPWLWYDRSILGFPPLSPRLVDAWGGSGGTLRSTSCEEGYLAAGVTGSTHPTHGYLRTFGLICVPEVGWNLPYYRETGPATWKVETGTASWDFNTYVNEALDVDTELVPYATEPGLAIPDHDPTTWTKHWVSTSIEVENPKTSRNAKGDQGTIEGEVLVQLFVAHAFPGDLRVELEHEGVRVEVFVGSELPWDKQGEDNLSLVDFPVSGFEGHDVGGTWTLHVRDHGAGDTGVVETFGLDFPIGTRFENQQRPFVMCGPGQYVTGMLVAEENGYIGGISAIQCGALSNDAVQDYKYPERPLGTRTSGADKKVCEHYGPNKRRAVAGALVREGWWVDRIQLMCL